MSNNWRHNADGLEDEIQREAHVQNVQLFTIRRCSLNSVFRVAFLALIFCSATAVYAQSAIVKSGDILRAEPNPTAASSGNVAANSKVSIIERKGFWAKIKSGDNTGWVKLTVLSIEQGGAASSPGAVVSGLSGLTSGRSGTGNIVSASGTRGLSAEDLKGATPNMSALAQMKSHGISAEDAQRFAKAGNLKPRSIAYLPAPGNTNN